MWAVAWIVPAVMAGQLIVAATAKASGLTTFAATLPGRIQPFAAPLVAAEGVLAVGIATGFPTVRATLTLGGAFYLAGGAYRMGVVLREAPDHRRCMCAHRARPLGWSDVLANWLIAAAAFGLVRANPPVSAPLVGVLGGCLMLYLSAWWRADRRRRAVRVARELRSG
jgi:hypothetical protein